MPVKNEDAHYKKELQHRKDCAFLAYHYLMECKNKDRAELSADWDLHSVSASRYNILSMDEMRRPFRETMSEFYRLSFIQERHEIIAEIAHYIHRSKLDPVEFGDWKKNFKHSESFWWANNYAEKIGDKGFLDFNFMEDMKNE